MELSDLMHVNELISKQGCFNASIFPTSSLCARADSAYRVVSTELGSPTVTLLLVEDRRSVTQGMQWGDSEKWQLAFHKYSWLSWGGGMFSEKTA